MDKAQSADPVSGKTVAEVLGEIVWLMTQDPVGREMKVSEIEELVIPAILARRFHIKYAQASVMQQAEATTLQPVEVMMLVSAKTAVDQSAPSIKLLIFSLRKALQNAEVQA